METFISGIVVGVIMSIGCVTLGMTIAMVIKAWK